METITEIGRGVCMHPGRRHSDDVVEVWHGRTTPAIGCGFHAHNYGTELTAAHSAILAGE